MDRKTKQLTMTERGIIQSQNQAMGGSIVKGLIELITNSHDAYGDNPGDINITYQNRNISRRYTTNLTSLPQSSRPERS